MRYRFETFSLDTNLRELRDGDKIVEVAPLAFDLLVYLVENRDRVASKDDIVEHVWSGRFVSDATISSGVSAARKALGDAGQDQRMIKTQHGRGFRFVATVEELDRAARAQTELSVSRDQKIRMCSSLDGTRIAYAEAGEGPPLVKAGNWLNHLELDWQSPVWSHIFTELSANHRLVRYDSRGNGLSSWDVSDFTLERQVEDLEAVVDAAGLDRFPMFCLSQGTIKGIAYAAKHPERVTRLMILGGYTRGWRVRAKNDDLMMSDALVHMLRIGWGKDNPAVRKMFSNIYMPDAPLESQDWFSDLQRSTTSPENAANNLSTFGYMDAHHLLADVKVPTLVVHARGDAGVPYSEGQEMAAQIPGAEFVTLDTTNHLLPESDREWEKLRGLIREFFG